MCAVLSEDDPIVWQEWAKARPPGQGWQSRVGSTPAESAFHAIPCASSHFCDEQSLSRPPRKAPRQKFFDALP